MASPQSPSNVTSINNNKDMKDVKDNAENFVDQGIEKGKDLVEKGKEFASKAADKIESKFQNKIPKEIAEGRTTRNIETVTARVPSVGYLGLAIGSMALSALLASTRKRELANFVGLWAPSILIMGLYNKVVKIEHEIAEMGAAEIKTH